MRTRKVALMVVVVSAFVATPLAWGQATTASVTGEVLDPGGQPVREAFVVATNARTGLVRTSETGAEGVYRIPALPPGPYKVEVTQAGLFAAPVEIELRIGQVARLDLSMSAQRVETVTVTAETPILNLTETEVSTIVDPTKVQELPLVNRDFADLANLAPGAKPKQTGQLDPTKNTDIYQPFTIGAGNGRQVNVQVDGGDNNDNAVGAYAGGLSAEAIQEFEIITDQYKAEYGRATQGVVNVITKSGTNDLEASFFALYRDQDFRARNFSEKTSGEDKSDSERRQYGVSVGGPLVRDTLFGFLAYERTEEDEPLSYSPLIQGPGFDSVEAILGGSGYTTGLERDRYTAKVNWNIDSSNTAYVRYNSDESEFVNDQLTPLVPERFGGSSVNEAWSGLASWTSVIGTDMVNELTVQVSEFENGVTSSTPADSTDYFTRIAFDPPGGVPGFTWGRALSTPQATIIEKFQLRNDFSWIVGDHDLKFGVDIVDVEFPQRTVGPPDRPTVEFNVQEDVAPDTFFENPDDLTLVDSIRFRAPGLTPQAGYTQIGLYGQDTWRLTDRWTLYYGLRYDKDDGVFDSSRTGVNAQFYRALASSTNPNVPEFENTLPEDPETFSPRAGFIYRIGGGDTDVIRGSWGIFYDKVIENLTFFNTRNLSPVATGSLPTLSCENDECDANAPVAGADDLPADFTYANWVAPDSALQDWYVDLLDNLGPATDFTELGMLFAVSPDWKMSRRNAYSLAWGHRFNADWASDVTAQYASGSNIGRVWVANGRPGSPALNTGIEPVAPNGFQLYFMSNGRTEYTSLQMQLRGEKPKYTLIFNVNVSRAEGQQDSGASADEAGQLDIFRGGRRVYTGYDASVNDFCGSATAHGDQATFGSGPICFGPEDDEGRISGDQTLWTSVAAIYRLPLGFRISGDASYGSAIAFRPSAGYDTNNDGIADGQEFIGEAGSGEGDTFFNLNVRVTKNFALPRDMNLKVFLEVFNVTDESNYGLFVNQQQATPSGDTVLPNPAYGQPTGNFLGTPRTVNAGLRFTY